jgi:hypothetical protein
LNLRRSTIVNNLILALKISNRLFCYLLYDRLDRNILLTNKTFLKSLNIKKVDQIILFDFIPEEVDLLRLFSKFKKDNNQKLFHILYDKRDIEKHKTLLDKLN